MKQSWFYHDPMTASEADELIRRYQARGIAAEKKLAVDPRFFTVCVFLPVSKYEPRPSQQFQQYFWQ